MDFLIAGIGVVTWRMRRCLRSYFHFFPKQLLGSHKSEFCHFFIAAWTGQDGLSLHKPLCTFWELLQSLHKALTVQSH